MNRFAEPTEGREPPGRSQVGEPPLGSGRDRQPRQGRGDGGRRHGHGQESTSWDAAVWRQMWEEANAVRDENQMRACLKEVAQSNYRLVQGPFSQDVARTELITRRELNPRREHLQGSGTIFSISPMTTGDALLHYADVLKKDGKVVCALNFANGEHVGGGYLRGARAQEEELCRQFPCMYTTLSRAKEYGHAYPFGACTYEGGRDTKRYADVLFTPRVVARRYSQAEGYAVIRDARVLSNIAIVSAAAPNIKGGREIFDPELVKQAMESILLAPKCRGRSIDVLILGAWGCGAFGCDPHIMAKLFAEVLVKGSNLGCLYKEIHFAIPESRDSNLQIFAEVLKKEGVPLSMSSSF